MSNNPAMHGVVTEAMNSPIPDEMKDIAKSLGVSSKATMGELMDHLRVMTYIVDTSELAKLYEAFGWKIDVEEAEDGAVHGDHIGSMKIDGKSTPIFIHMGITTMFDRTDPALERVFKDAAKGRKSAVVIQPMPSFYPDRDADGAVTRVLVFGGWHLKDEVWSPFLVSPQGNDDILAQKRFIKNGPPSRGLLRERSHDRKAIGLLRDFFGTMKNRIDLAGGGDGRIKIADQIAFIDSGWAQFAPEQAMEGHKMLSSSLGVPTPRARQFDGDMESARDIAPSGLVEHIDDVSPDRQFADTMIEHLAHLTDGFAGLDDNTWPNVSADDISSLMACSTAQIHPMEIAGILEDQFGWTISAVNYEKDEKHDDCLLMHGDLVLEIDVPGRDLPVPIIFHGGEVDPTAAQEDFAFMATRLAAQLGFDGSPVIVLPANVAARGAPGEPRISENGAPETLAIRAGYAFDGRDWFPITFGARGSDPFKNKLLPDALIPAGESGYTKPTGKGDEAKLPFASLAILQMAIDRHHHLGPDVRLPRDFEPHRDYDMGLYGDDWFFMNNIRQAEAHSAL